MIHLHHIIVSGKVQGVFFRASTREVAEELGITGYVMNMPDGRVYIEAEGSSMQLSAFEDWLKKGPELAKVEDLIIDEGDPQGYKNFAIRHED